MQFVRVVEKDKTYISMQSWSCLGL